MYTLSSIPLEPQLIVNVFEIEKGQAFLVQGNLHIRCPHKKTPSITTKKRMVREAMKCMEEVANSILCENVAIVFGGDCNLEPDQAEECTQESTGEPDIRTSWHIQHANAKLSGDVVFCRGAYTEVFDI